MNETCIFCRIAAGEAPAFRIYEDDAHIAFLDLYPSVRGQTLVIPREHLGSNVFEMDEARYTALLRASRSVARSIDKCLGALRTCMVMEGMEIDHAHIKLYPIHEVLRRTAEGVIDLNRYPGYLSTLHGARASAAELADVAAKFGGAVRSGA